MLLTLAATETISWGVLYYSFTVFLTPMERDLGWSRSALTGAFSLSLLLSGLAGVPVGRWLDRHGPRALMTAGSILAALLVAAWSAVSDLALFYVIWAGIGLTMAATFYEPAFWVVATWFRAQRSRALTVLTFVAGFASVIFIPLADALVRAQGWRTALLSLALCLAVGTILPHALVLRRHPSAVGLGPDGRSIDAERSVIAAAGQPLQRAQAPAEHSLTAREALRDPGFWWLSAAFFLVTLGAGAMVVHLTPYLIGAGYAPAFAAQAAGLVGLVALPGRVIFTPLGDWLPRRLVTAVIFVTQAIAMIVLLRWQSPTGVLAYAVLVGAGFGAITPARAALVAERYGAAHYGRISSVLALFLTGARALAPVGASLGVQVLGGYGPVLWALAACSVLAAVAVLVSGKQSV
jgi:sugar phosphate permease